MKLSKKNIIFMIAGLLIVSFLVFVIVGRANADDNKIAIKNIKMVSIDTGGNYQSDDNLNYDFTTVEGYTAGNDSSPSNRIVRSFDKITYKFNFSIVGKDDVNDYEERKVDIKVILSDEDAKYIAFDENSIAGEKERIFTFDGIDTYDVFEKEITLYVLGAPNKMRINPRFEIQESTNTDPDYVISLGSNNFDADVYNYEYDLETESYSTVSSVSGFKNYMPTLVSSKTANVVFKLIPQTDGQKAMYEDKVGRYLTYVLGLEIVGDDTNGIKGYTMPTENITFDVSMSQNGNNQNVISNNDWKRLYGTDVISSITPIEVDLPYSSSSSDVNKRTKYPGTISISDNKATISDYNFTYTPIKVNANGSEISNSTYVFGTYAFTLFSERVRADVKNDIIATLSINNISAKDTTGNDINISPVTASAINKYYESIDYSLTGEFYDTNGSKLSQTKSLGSASKGTQLTYKTIFNYKKTLSDQGLKEIIKIDTNAFRVIPNGEKDINITIEKDDDVEFSEDDLEIKFVTGDFNNSNYSTSQSTRIANEDLSTVNSTCPTDLSGLSFNQIMNLYGGPCIKATDNSEITFDSIMSAKTESDKELPITKVIIQTKEGVVLPDNVKITVDLSIRIRDVKDLTQTYQIASVASSSDYDSVLTYYSPRITNDSNSITNPNNYEKTVYQGTNPVVTGNKAWADSLKIVNFTSRQEITVTNKNTDGTIKTNYNVNKGETINYNIKTIIGDNNMNVGADDVWYINSLYVLVTLPSELTYVPDKDLDKYLTYSYTSSYDGKTYLTYSLPYTKPNQILPEINFKATIKPTLKGSGVPIAVTSEANARNINNEVDTSYFPNMNASYTIYATGLENVIVSQKIGDSGSVVEKDSEFSYLLYAYNNTNSDITDYSILDILPFNNDSNGSTFSGKYKVKVVLPDSLGNAKIYCSTSNKLINEVLDENNEFEECDIDENYKEVTAIKITNISIAKATEIEAIKVLIKPEGNDYSDKYINVFTGASRTYSQNESNEIEARVVSRTISGNVFIDINEDGVKDNSDLTMQDVPLTLYKLDSENNMTKVEDTVSNKDGYYEFKNLNVGRYKVRANYNKELYDLTLRYAIEDTSIDSDAYKIEDGKIEISNKRTPYESDGIRVTREIETVSNMDIGLISRKNFGFDIDKFITRVDLTYNNNLTVHNYNNLKTVKEDVLSSLNASAKVYYGIKITNNSTASGYVKLINENIPQGATFDGNLKENEGWFYYNGELRNASLENDLINPGETRYLTVVLNIPPQQEYRTYVNTVTLMEIEKYEPEALTEDENYDPNIYHVGEAVSYAGVDWHVISAEGSGNDQTLTLLADSGTVPEKMSHIYENISEEYDIYKWSTSSINNYLNYTYGNMSSFEAITSIDRSVLYETSICDDASGLPVASYGGTLQSEGKCQSGIYNSYKIRLLAENEYNKLKTSNLNDYTWLDTNVDFWLQNSVYVEQEYDSYGRIKDNTNVKNLAKYISNSSVKTGYNTNVSNWVTAKTKKEVRPVITLSSKNIIAE